MLLILPFPKWFTVIKYHIASLLLHNKLLKKTWCLKTANMCITSKVVWVRNLSSFTQFSGSGSLTRLPLRCWSELLPYLKVQLGKVTSRLLTWQASGPPNISFHRGLSTGLFTTCQLDFPWGNAERVRKIEQAGQKPEFFGNLNSEVTNHHFCYILLIRNMWKDITTSIYTQGRGLYTHVWIPGGRDHGGHHRGVCHIHCIHLRYFYYFSLKEGSRVPGLWNRKIPQP